MPDITIATEPMAALATEHGCSLHASGTSSHPVVIVTSEGDATKPRTSISWLLSVGPDGEPRTIVMADMVGPRTAPKICYAHDSAAFRTASRTALGLPL